MFRITHSKYPGYTLPSTFYDHGSERVAGDKIEIPRKVSDQSDSLGRYGAMACDRDVPGSISTYPFVY